MVSLFGLRHRTNPYPNLPKPTFLWVLIINPNIDFRGTLQKSRFWRVKVGPRPKAPERRSYRPQLKEPVQSGSVEAKVLGNSLLPVGCGRGLRAAGLIGCRYPQHPQHPHDSVFV